MAVASQVRWRLLLIVGGGCIVLGLLFGTKGFAQTETLPAPNKASPQAGQPGAESRPTPGSRPPAVDKDVQVMPIDLATALAAYTSGSARTNGLESVTGSIKTGLDADFAILDADLAAIESREICRASVRQTWLRGRPA